MKKAPALAGGTFLANWGGLTVGDLFERMRTTMPQDDPGKLSSQQYADILAFVLSGNEFPAGKTEVGTHAEMLKMIQIDPNKPASKEAPAAAAKAGQDADAAGDAGKGKQLFAKVGCANCHGASAEGGAGPKIAPPPIALPEFLKFVRKPTGEMTPFSQDQVSDTGLTDIYAFLQSISPAPKATRLSPCSGANGKRYILLSSSHRRQQLRCIACHSAYTSSAARSGGAGMNTVPASWPVALS